MTEPPDTLFHGKLVRFVAPSSDDASIVARFSEDGQYMRWMDTDAAIPSSVDGFRASSTNKVSDGKSFVFHLRTIEEDSLIGFVAIHSIEWNNQTGILSIGIWDPAYREKGYGSDAMALALNYVFNELNLYRLGLDVISTNSRAIRVYEKMGFRHEGLVRGAVNRDGKRVDKVIMGILREEYLEAL
jgi:RimJ/RimL family protein N-acetyltransferase